MAIGNFGLPFNQHRAQKYDIRTRPSKYAESEIRNWRFEQSEGIRPAEYYAPYKYLPVQLQDVTTEDWVVMPKGRIVAALSTEDTTPLSGIVYPSSTGYINVGISAPELDSAKINAQIDNDYYGYDMHINGLLVPCNGGATMSGFYTADDATALTMTNTGAVAVASGAFVLPANCPIGVVYHDWYQDIRGKWLNYRMHADGGHVLTDWYVEIPYVKVSDTGSYSGVDPEYHPTTVGDYANLIKWRTVNKQYTYLTVNVNDSEVFRNGVLVMSDLIGNYKLQPAATFSAAASGIIGGAAASAYNNIITNQTVGKILAIDNRFPKDMLEDVQTYPRSGMPGTQTAGMPKFLFDFVYDCINIGTGTAPTVEGIYDAIRGGSFGLVRIQLLVS
jgi:hypothetical protein